MPKIFISYRRDDTHDIVGRIYDHLTANMDKDAIYYDVDVTPYGADYRQHIRDSLRDCTDCLVIIGKRFISRSGQRLHKPSDMVRIEIECALTMDLRVIPVLVNGTVMPIADQLPLSIKELAYRNAFEIGSDRNFNVDMKRLIDFISSQKQALDKMPSKKVAEFNVFYANEVYTKSRSHTRIILQGTCGFFGQDTGKLTVYSDKLNYTGKMIQLDIKYTDILVISMSEMGIHCVTLDEDSPSLSFSLFPFGFLRSPSNARTADAWSCLEPYLKKFLQCPTVEEVIERAHQLQVKEEMEEFVSYLQKRKKYYIAQYRE